MLTVVATSGSKQFVNDFDQFFRICKRLCKMLRAERRFNKPDSEITHLLMARSPAFK